MPYIKKNDRGNILKWVEEEGWEDRLEIKTSTITNAGEFNFAVTSMVKEYLITKGESYQTYNDIMGALEGCKLELYRRKIAPYEDIKIKENGDVF